MKSSAKSLYACSISKFSIPKPAKVNELYRDQTDPSFNKDSEIKVGKQGDNILDDITMDSEVTFSFRETPSHSNSDVRTFKAALDHYRRQYLLEKRLKS